MFNNIITSATILQLLREIFDAFNFVHMDSTVRSPGQTCQQISHII